MRPLAAHEEEYGAGGTPDYGGTAQHSPDWGDGAAPSHDPAAEEGGQAGGRRSGERGEVEVEEKSES